ncbi:MAG: response regulator receiver protein [Clostridia bacterium]|jgi:DNA-binding response OmpR family regulator|nr:response regulator receiver protein [Clostridia bacterium]
MDNRQKVVLIVDDSPSIIRQVTLILQKSDIAVRQAGSEFGMLNAIEQYGRRVDLIIMDLTLKTEHGFDLIATLKDSLRFRSIPILVLTEHADVKNVLTAKQLGVNGYIKKPIDVNELLTQVKTLLFKG